jgi:hypothetical protein
MRRVISIRKYLSFSWSEYICHGAFSMRKVIKFIRKYLALSRFEHTWHDSHVMGRMNNWAFEQTYHCVNLNIPDISALRWDGGPSPFDHTFHWVNLNIPEIAAMWWEGGLRPFEHTYHRVDSNIPGMAVMRLEWWTSPFEQTIIESIWTYLTWRPYDGKNELVLPLLVFLYESVRLVFSPRKVTFYIIFKINDTLPQKRRMISLLIMKCRKALIL